MERYLDNFKNCLQKDIPFCAAQCPFHFDILDFIEKMKRGDCKAAFKTYRNAVGFPNVASALCHEPCKGVCPRRHMDSAIELGKLEKACMAFSHEKGSTHYNLPLKKKKVAIIGAGLSGLACALRLCMKKYEVVIFEATSRIGGSLYELMSSDVFLPEIAEQFKHEKYTLQLNACIESSDDLVLSEFDAVYVATGKDGNDFGLLLAATENGDQYCSWHGKAGWFAGGGLTGDEPIYALAGGLHMGTVIDNFLKTNNLFYPSNVQNTKMCLNPVKLQYQAPVIAVNGESFTEDEAQCEAARCIQCQCDSCRIYCDLTEFYNKWPLKIRDEVMATTLPGSSEVKATPAKRLMSTCNQCGLCKETCPEDIDLGGLILAGRQSMHRQHKVSWAYHDFWLRDMDFANGDLAAVTKAGENKYAFFPGCQLGASDPGLVEKAYAYLVSKRGDTGLMLRCCGVPAQWAGDDEKYKQELATIRSLWENIGKPILILACPTCEKQFKMFLPDITVVSLYEIMADWGVEGLAWASRADFASKVYSVFDPCSARHENHMKESVRKLAESAGCILEPLPQNDAFARCCSYGGQPVIANPIYAEFVTKKRISESDNPYIAYCINCRDIFRDAGKETVHILDLILGDGDGFGKLTTITKRRENRMELKKQLLKDYWNEEMEQTKRNNDIRVNISPELAEKLSRERILEEEVATVIEFCQRTGRKVYQPERKSVSGYFEVGFMTYWVEYKNTSVKDTFDLINAYSHRMRIELEPVWNGRKINIDS